MSDRHFANYRGRHGDTLSVTVEDGAVTIPESGLDAMLAVAGFERVGEVITEPEPEGETMRRAR